MLKTLAFCLAFWIGSAQAESWTSEDKGLHFVGSATLAVLITSTTESHRLGFWSVVALGVIKEAVDRGRPNGDASAMDLAAGVAGAYLGSQAGGWLIRRRGDSTALSYAIQF